LARGRTTHDARPGGDGADQPARQRHGRCGQSSPELRATQLWCPVFDGLSSYGAVAAWGSHLGNPRLAAVNEKGCTTTAMLSLTLVEVGASSSYRTVLETSKMGAVVLVEDRRGVASARVAQPQRDNNGEQ
jgi:hypothetical protein